MTVNIGNMQAMQKVIVDNAAKITKTVNIASLAKGLSFDQVLGQAMAALHSAPYSDQFKIAKKMSKKGVREGINSVEKERNILFAQIPGVIGGVARPALRGNPAILNRVPLQMFLDKAILALDNVSRQEFRVNDLIQGFVDGKISEDEVIIETAKLNLIMSMITTIVQSAVTAFKEIQQIPV